MDALDGVGAACRMEIPWYRDYDCVLPIDATASEVQQTAHRLATVSQRSGVSILALCSAVVHPRMLNDLIERFDSKGAALTHVTLQLVRRLMDSLGSDFPTTVVCDKHGGRNRYAAQLQDHFPEQLIRVRQESRAASQYSMEQKGRRQSFHFRAKGESFLPSALASMVSKYVRELCMRALNEFWTSHQPGLRPTAGYPLDAKRFKEEIAATQRRLDIEDQLLWRVR
jgi:hypothetical protein